MIASLTFTYGTERTDIYKYKSKDKLDSYFRQNLDYNLYVFHNSPDTFVKEIKEKKLLNNLNIQYSSLTGPYPSALKTALLFLKQKGIKKIIFLQDDVFSCKKDVKLYDDLLNFCKSTSENYLNLEFVINDQSFVPSYKTSTFNVYNVKTDYFRQNKIWSFDDSPYYANLDFAINEIYDNTYFSYPDVWSAEWYLKAKFDQKNVPRPLTNKQFFRRVNFLGPNDWNKENELIFLKENFK